MIMRVEVLTPWQHDGEDVPVGSFVTLEEDDVRRLKGTVSQDDIPEPPPAPASEPAAPDHRVAATEANAVRLGDGT